MAVEGEEVKLITPQQIDGEVETWMHDVEKTVADSIAKQLFSAVRHVGSLPFSEMLKKHNLQPYIRTYLGQLLLVTGQIQWTKMCQSALRDPKNKVSF